MVYYNKSLLSSFSDTSSSISPDQLMLQGLHLHHYNQHSLSIYVVDISKVSLIWNIIVIDNVEQHHIGLYNIEKVSRNTFMLIILNQQCTNCLDSLLRINKK